MAPRWGDPGDVAPEDREPGPPDLAGLWPRIGARLLDALLVGLTVGVLAAVLSLPDSLGLLLTLVAMTGYETLMLANGGQTLAKMLLLLWVVPLGWPIAAVLLERQRRRQGLHDRAAGTLVVVARPAP